MSTPARPELKFDTIDAMLADAEHLRSAGYEQAGRWTLGMVLDHLTKAMSGPFGGGRNLPWPLSAAGRSLMHGMVRRGRYPAMKFPAPASFRPDPGVDPAAASEAFRSVCERAKALPGDTVVCPPLGRVPTTDYLGVQLLHGAHHLSYLRPIAP